MLKFKRNYQAVFYIKDDRTDKEEVVIIEPPFTVSFKTTLGYLNEDGGSFQFINLDYDVQKKLWRDFFDESHKRIRLQFFAGYGKTEDLPLMVDFDVFRCTSERASGSVDVITTVQCMNCIDSGSSYAYANVTFEEKSKYIDIVSNLIDKIPNLKVGFVADDLGELPNSRTFMGNAIDLIKSEFKNHYVYINNNELNIIKPDDYIFSEIPLISETTGMLGTPRVEEQYMSVDMMFEPNLKPLQLVYLESSYRLLQKQLYKVYNVSHSGTIGETSASNLTTSLTLELFKLDEKKDENIAKKPLQQKEEAREKAQATTSFNWIRPVEGGITSNFGMRIHPITKDKKFHNGIDIGANAGSNVKAPANGIIDSVSYDNINGNRVRINHGNGVISIYIHLERYLVKSGQNVSQGDIIGIVGSTGQAKGAHLHFSIKENDAYVNPNKYVRY